jgi:phage-related protein
MAKRSIITPKKVTARFYKTDAGNEPVRDWLLDLSDADMKIVGTDIATVEFGWPVGMPTCKALGNGLYEVRSNISGRISRVFFEFDGSEIVLLHAIVKKTQQTPKSDLALARKRMGN